MTKRVAIIGAGCSGLAAIKSCLDEDLTPVCFESAADLGGLWLFTDDVTDRRGCVMSSTVINTSKEMMSFSDFPAPRQFPNFMPHKKVLEYFRLYAENFQLMQHIRFNTEVLSVKESSFVDKFNKSSDCVLHKTNAQSKAGRDECIKNKSSKTDSLKDNFNNFYHQHEARNGNDGCESAVSRRLLSGRSDSALSDGSVSERVLDLKLSGPWDIQTKDKQTEVVATHQFDCVLICSGHHADVNAPYFPGQSVFKGRVIHSRDLRRPDKLAGSRHVVVGVGNSGCDAAVELSRHGQVYLSTRRGTWLMQRLQKHGLPADIVYMSRLIFATALRLPSCLLNKMTEFHLNRVVDHSLYGLNPKHGPFATHPTVNDELPNRIASGHVVLKSNIDFFTENGIRFDDDTEVDDIDTVVMATGYKISFPFLDQSVLTVKGNQCQLFLHMFPPAVTPPTLAVIGCVQPGGAIGPVSEMQCRLATRVFKKDVQLPTQKEMLQDIESKKRAIENRYIHTQRHTVQVDYVPYMDELAVKIGCKPQLCCLLLRDPGLAFTCFFGPCTSYQFRLMGPGRWTGARDAIMTQMDRVRFPFHTRQTGISSGVASLCGFAITTKNLFAALCLLSTCILLGYIL